MATESAMTTTTGSIARRFNISLALLYFLSIVVSAPAIYYFTHTEVFSQANSELRLLGDLVKSIKGYIGKDMRPWFVQNKQFHSAGFSGIVAVSRVAENLKEIQGRYAIRNVSDNPLNPANSPEPLEQQLLREFRDDRSVQYLETQGELGGQLMLINSAPIVSQPGCLQCHGEPAKVHPEITGQYGRTSGYNYKDGDVVGLELVGVPIADVNALAMERSLVAVGLLTLMFGLIFVTINLLVRRNLISPILEITDAAQAVAKGDLDRTLDIQRNDEIGDLARSVELLRRSFAQVMKRFNRTRT
jgi:methyl-accepting chemotaxis protein